MCGEETEITVTEIYPSVFAFVTFDWRQPNKDIGNKDIGEITAMLKYRGNNSRTLV